MQKFRTYGEVRLGFSQPGTVDTTLPNATQMDSSAGQLEGSQPKRVQYPPGWLVSQMRSPVWEHSESTEHESPMLGWHPASKTRANSAHVGVTKESWGDRIHIGAAGP